VIQVSTHLFGSTDGYTTLAKSAHVSEADEHALSIFGFGSPKSQEDIDQLTRHPSVAGRLLPSGRFAITRLFPGKPDVAGRDTVERRSIIFSAQDWKCVVRCDLESLINDQQAFEREVFAKSLPHSVQVNDSEDLLPCAQELERRLYDIMLSTPRHNACALLADDPVNRRGLLQLLKLLPIQEACHLSWGLGLFAATPGVRIATASASVGASPNANWPSMIGNLAHPEKVAQLGMNDDAFVAAKKLNVGMATRSNKKVSMEIVVKHLHWIILGFVIVALGLIYAAYKSRAQNQIASQQPNTPMQQAIEPVQNSNEIQLPAPVKDKEEKLESTAIQAVHPLLTPPVTPPAIPPVTPPAIPPATTESKSPEPVNLFDGGLELWKKAKNKRVSIQINPTDVVHTEAWLATCAEDAKALVDLQDKIKTQIEKLDCKEKKFINLNSAELSPKPNQAEKVCSACILVLAQCEIIAAHLEINEQLASNMKKNKPANDLKTLTDDIDAAFKKIEMPDSMWTWITTKNISKKEMPMEKIRQWLDPKLRALFKNTFPISTAELPTLP